MIDEAGPALEARDLTKSFGATRALQGASLTLAAGQVHALLGENGSGKSTFAKILAGIHPADLGTVLRDGREVAIDDPAFARALGIGIVFQELSLAPDLDVVDNLFLGRERSRLPGWLDRGSEVEACRAMLGRLGLSIDLFQPVRRLGMAQKQLLEIGKALLHEPDILIFDEPTASLTEREVAHLFDVIGEMRKNGRAILYVTHHLREVLHIADRVSVMRDGRIVAGLDVGPDTTEEQLIRLLTEKRLNTTPLPARTKAATPILRVSGLHTTICRDVSFDISPGEIVGLYGVVGCGREDIGRSLVGLHRPQVGVIEVGGKAHQPVDPADALALGVGFLPSDRKQEGILPNRSIRENLTLSSLDRLTKFGFLSWVLEQATSAERLAALRVKFASAEDLITSLSGGNQQKVLFGRAMAAAPRLLVLEDPTAGIDIGAKYDLYEQIRRAADTTNMSFLWMSTELTETLTLCHRVYAMYRGRIVTEIVNPTLADEDRLLAAVLGRVDEEVAA
jgi:ribose transport system ATP-binding protein